METVGLYNYRVGSEANVCKYTLPVMLDGDIGVVGMSCCAYNSCKLGLMLV